MNLEVEKVSDLCNFQNCQDLDIKENSVVIMEIKSSRLNLYDCEQKKNPLEYFVDNALLFIEIYKKLNLIEEKQDIIFIYMFNNSMAFNIKKDSRLIQNEIEKLNKKNINLYIAFFQPYCKLLSFYEENRKYNNLVAKTKELENRLEEQKNGFQNQIKELKEFFKTLSSKNNLEDKETIDSAIQTDSSDKIKDGDSIGNSFGDN